MIENGDGILQNFHQGSNEQPVAQRLIRPVEVLEVVRHDIVRHGVRDWDVVLHEGHVEIFDDVVQRTSYVADVAAQHCVVLEIFLQLIDWNPDRLNVRV